MSTNEMAEAFLALSSQERTDRADKDAATLFASMGRVYAQTLANSLRLAVDADTGPSKSTRQPRERAPGDGSGAREAAGEQGARLCVSCSGSRNGTKP